MIRCHSPADHHILSPGWLSPAGSRSHNFSNSDQNHHLLLWCLSACGCMPGLEGGPAYRAAHSFCQNEDRASNCPLQAAQTCLHAARLAMTVPIAWGRHSKLQGDFILAPGRVTAYGCGLSSSQASPACCAKVGSGTS